MQCHHATTCHHYCHHYCGRLAAQLHGGRWPQLCPVRAHLCFVLLHRGFGSAPGKPSAPWEATTSFANLCLNELGYLVGWLDELVNCLHNLHTENKPQDSRQVTASGEEWSFLADANFSEWGECNWIRNEPRHAKHCTFSISLLECWSGVFAWLLLRLEWCSNPTECQFSH